MTGPHRLEKSALRLDCLIEAPKNPKNVDSMEPQCVKWFRSDTMKKDVEVVKCIGRILLYTFECWQYAEVWRLWEEEKGGWEGKNNARTSNYEIP